MRITRDDQELLADYARAFTSGQKPAQPIPGIQARVCRRRPGQPVRLSEDPDRRIVFLVDDQVCHEIIGLGGYRIATEVLGWLPAYTRQKVEAGCLFDLVVFAENACELATWDKMLDLVEAAYPEIRAKIARHRAAIRAMTPASLVAIERQRGYSFLEVDGHGSDDPRFMTLARYLDGPDTPEAARAFLYHVVHCRELFGGAGRTLDGDGGSRVREYIMPNRPLEALGDHVVIPMRIEVP